MKIVTIYKTKCTASYSMSEQGVGFSLEPWGTDADMIKGSDDGGQEYLLPDGYRIAESKSGSIEIYDDDDNHCSLVSHSSGRPQIVSGSNKMPVLTLLVEEFSDREIMLFRNNLEWYVITDENGNHDLKHQSALASVLECGEDPLQFGYTNIERCWNGEDLREDY